MEPYVNCFRSTELGWRQTCMQCRLRKVRCGGEHGICRNCERLGLACSLSLGAERGHDAAARRQALLARPKRRRGSRACRRCRDQKVRCSGTLPQCSNCKQRGLSCTYPTPKRPIRAPSSEGASDAAAVSEGTPSQSHCASCTSGATPAAISAPTVPPRVSGPHFPAMSGLRSSALGEHLPSSVEIFFDRVYPLPSYAFLHPATTKEGCKDGKLEESLAFAICGLAALHAGHQDRGSYWIQTAEQIVWQQLECLKTPRLQALLLIIHHRMETGHFQRAFMLTALAARSAVAMRLNYERPDLGVVAQEVRRRIMWSLKLVERYFSIGLPEFELCPFEAIYLQPPCHEDAFRADGDVCVPSLRESGNDDGSFNLCVKLESLRRDIMKLSRSIALCDGPFPQLPKLIQDLEKELSSIGAQTPHGVDLSSIELGSLLNGRWLPRHILMRLSWHQCHCDIYRLLLPGYREAAPQAVLGAMDARYIATAERPCLDHATSIIQILTNLNQQSTSHHLLEFDTAICAYQATLLVLHISRFGIERQRPTSEFAASRADLCVAALKRFFPSSALVKPIVKEMERRIEAFSSRGDVQCRQSSPCAGDGHRNPAPQLFSAAKVRQRLAIHSLLRQAEFADDDVDEPSSMANRLGEAAQEPPGSSAKALSSYTTADALPGPKCSTSSIHLDNTVSHDQSHHDVGLVGGWGLNLFYPEEAEDFQFTPFPWFNQDLQVGDTV